MDLILKPTEKCNFKCSFCSSTQIAEDSNDLVPLETIYRFLERYPETNTIIVNGGDPLMMPPQYYRDLINHLDRNDLHATISFTSNLWPFYRNPDKWVGIFRSERVGITTSFQYGGGRLKHDLTPYTEEEFWRVSDTMLKHAGYRPSFIAVITEENEHTVLQTVELAKRMGVVCKVNYAYGSGVPVVRKGQVMGNRFKPYVLAKIYEHYLAIHNAGLTEWEHNTQQMIRSLAGRHTICPLIRSCDTNIRVIQPSGRYYSCGAFGDDDLYGIDFESEMAGNFHTPLQDAYELQTLKQSCYTCPMFDICNGCRKTIHELKETDQVEAHCKQMKALTPDLLEAAGRDPSEVTEYVDESA